MGVRPEQSESGPVTNLAELLLQHPFGADVPLLHAPGMTITAGEARDRARSLAEELRLAGVGAGQAVGLLLPTSPEFVVAMMGVWVAGAVMVPINDRLPPAAVDEVVEALSLAAVVEQGGPRRTGGTRGFDPDVAFVTWTSGTTGVPKPIVHTHRAYVELLDRVLNPLRAGSENRAHPPSPNLIPVSLALNAGIYNALFGLRAGAALVIMERFDTGEFADLVRRFEIRSTVLPPAAITMLNDDPAIENLAPLRYVRSITAPLSALQARRFTERYGVFVLNSYGQAEIGEVIGWTGSDARQHPEKVGAAGRPLPGVTIKLVGDGSDPSGEVGELWVRPPAMAAGYATGETLADRVDEEGFVATGDLGRRDADGFVWIEGRVGDVINRGGNKIYPDEVEEVLRLSPAVREAAVVGIADDRLGEVPVAFVVTTTDPAEHELASLCRKHLVPYKVPVEFVTVSALPRTDIGKLRRAELASWYLREDGGAGS